MKLKSKLLVTATVICGLSAGVAAFKWLLKTEGQGQGSVKGMKEESSAKSLGGSVIGPKMYNVEFFVVPGPLRTNSAWEGWANVRAEELYQNRRISNSVTRVETRQISQLRENRTNWTLSAAVRITGISGAKITPNMLRFLQRSSDPSNIFTNHYSMVGGNFGFNDHTIGVDWGSSGEFAARSSHTPARSGSGNVPKDELVMVALQFPYFVYSSQAEYSEIENYVQTYNLAISTTVDVIDTSGAIVGSASVTIRHDGFRPRPRLIITRLSDGRIRLSSDLPQGHTMNLVSSAEVIGPWTSPRVGTLTAGEEMSIAAPTSRTFWAGILQ